MQMQEIGFLVRCTITSVVAAESMNKAHKVDVAQQQQPHTKNDQTCTWEKVAMVVMVADAEDSLLKHEAAAL